MRLILLLTYFLSIPFISWTQSYDSDSLIRIGIELHNNKQYPQALEIFQKVWSIDPNYARAQYEYCNTLNVMNEKEKLLQRLNYLYQKGYYSNSPDLYVLKGSYHSDNKEYEESERIFKEGIDSFPNYSLLQVNLAILYLKKEENQKAVEYLKRAIEINPKHARAHYLLGAILLESGKLAEAYLPLLAYLTLAPNDQFVKDVIKDLNLKPAENFLKTKPILISNDGDNFEELNTILRNQLPLNNKYPLKCAIDNVYTRNTQAVLEYAGSHLIKNGWLENIYIPFLKDINNKNYTEAFIYYSLSAYKSNLEKIFKAKSKLIKDFLDKYLTNEYWLQFGMRNSNITGTDQRVIIFYEEGFPSIIGPVVNGKYEGDFVILNSVGKVISRLKYKNGLLEGRQQYFYPDGKLKEETEFINHKKEGESKFYYTNGNLAVKQYFKNDVNEGLFTSFYPNGGKNCEINYKNGIPDGNLTCVFPDGQTEKISKKFKNGILDGSSKMWYSNGQLKAIQNFIEGKEDGESINYNCDNSISFKGFYKQGELTDLGYTYFYNNTTPKSIYTIHNKMGTSKYFDLDGSISNLDQYNSKNELVSTKYFHDNKVYFEENFENNRIISAKFIKQNGEEEKIDLSKYKFYDYDGILYNEGSFVNRKKEGKWTKYYRNGIKLSDEIYQNDILESGEYYNIKGVLESKLKMHEGQLNGENIFYTDNLKYIVQYYSMGELNGPSITFKDNKVIEEYINEDNQVFGVNNFYWPNQKFKSTIYWIDNYIVNETFFDTSGQIKYTFEYKNKTGTFTIGNQEKNIEKRINLLNGVRNGLYTETLIGQPKYEIQFKNNEKNGSYIEYGLLQKPFNNLNFIANQLHGLQKYYDMMGNLKIEANFLAGENTGLETRYYFNNKKQNEGFCYKDLKKGPFCYFNHAGDTIAILYYYYDLITSVKILNSGKLSDEILVSEKFTDFTSTYKNGKTAFKFSVKNNLFEGPFEINSEQGNTLIKWTYKDFLLDGSRIECYNDGKIYKQESFIKGYKSGEEIYYDSTGKLKLRLNYHEDELNGDQMIFENGNLLKTYQYYDGEFIKVK